MSAELFIEIRFEEMPAAMIRPAAAGLRDGVRRLLAGIDHGDVHLYATPRRFAVRVADVAEGKPVEEQLVTGPPAGRAFKDGEPTRAAQGFARGKGVAVEDLEIVDGPRGPVVAARVRSGGERTVDLVSAGLEALVLGLPFAKSMEWGTGGVRFGRPLHGVAALYGSQVLAGTVAGLPVAATSVGHRLAEDPEFSFTSATEWAEGLRARQVEPDEVVRRQRILDGLDRVAAELGADPIRHDSLLDEVVHLVEWPTVIVGSFDEDLLALPPRLLVESMVVHQRYFPVFVDGQLTNRFVITSNNPWADADLVAEGNARVLRARFHDAKFFFAEDKKQTLSEHAAELQKMRWIRGLGTMADKQRRVGALAAAVAPRVGADAEIAVAAGSRAKADLVTQMVGEFADLQGHMGNLYAVHEGLDPAVGAAIEEHYLPAGADDPIASSPAGVAVALADRLDTLVGCFGVGMIPKGGGDPQGLRRATAGILRTVVGHELRLDLSELFADAARAFHASAAGDEFKAWAKLRGADPEPADLDALVGSLLDFARARFKAAAIHDGATADLVDAVLEVGGTDPLVWQRKLEALRGIAGTPDFKPIMHTFKRVLNITRGHDFPAPSAADLHDPAEHELLTAVDAVEAELTRLAGELDYAGALDGVLSLREPVAAFFDAVMVESDVPAEREARLGLLLRVARLFLLVADFSRISTR